MGKGKEGADKALAYISRGIGGIGADFAGVQGRHLSSYERDLDRFVREHPESEGAIVVDLMSIAESDGFVGLVWRAPLCNPTITDGHVDRPLQGALDLGFAPLIAGNYFGVSGVKAVLEASTASESDSPGPLDSVSPIRLAGYWARHGARIGRVVDGLIWWDEEE